MLLQVPDACLAALQVVKLLLRYGGNPQQSNRKGETPLKVASSPTMVNLLLGKGTYTSSEESSAGQCGQGGAGGPPGLLGHRAPTAASAPGAGSVRASLGFPPPRVGLRFNPLCWRLSGGSLRPPSPAPPPQAARSPLSRAGPCL